MPRREALPPPPPAPIIYIFLYRERGILVFLNAGCLLFPRTGQLGVPLPEQHPVRGAGAGAGGGWPRAGWVTPPAEPLSGPILIRAAGHKASLCRAAPHQLPSPARSCPAAAPLHGGSGPHLQHPLLRAAWASPMAAGGRDPQTGMGQGTPGWDWGTGPPARALSSPSMMLTGSALEKLSPPSPPKPPSRGHGTHQLVL